MWRVKPRQLTFDISQVCVPSPPRHDPTNDPVGERRHSELHNPVIPVFFQLSANQKPHFPCLVSPSTHYHSCAIRRKTEVNTHHYRQRTHTLLLCSTPWLPRARQTRRLEIGRQCCMLKLSQMAAGARMFGDCKCGHGYRPLWGAYGPPARIPPRSPHQPAHSFRFDAFALCLDSGRRHAHVHPLALIRVAGRQEHRNIKDNLGIVSLLNGGGGRDVDRN